MSDFNPYTILGVEITATKKEIKAAYRAKSKDHHPDNSDGDAETFMLLKKAYDLLSDDVSRSYFDSTGETDINLQMVEKASVEILEKNLEMITEYLLNDSADIEHFDVSSAMVSLLEEQRIDMEKRMNALKKRLNMIRKISAKVKKIGEGRNIYRLILAKKSSALSSEINMFYMGIAANKMATEEAKSFTDAAYSSTFLGVIR